MNPVEYAWLIPAALLIGFFVGAWLWRREGGCILPAVVPMITASDISSRIVDVVRSIIMTIFEIATPIVNVVGIAQIILGLLLWFGARQEFLGWRLIISGLLMLIFMNVVAPFLLSFI
jgi:hypothetical protein